MSELQRDVAELGDLAPVRGVAEWLDRWIEDDTERRPADPALAMLREVRKKLVDALEDAAAPGQVLTLEELAKREKVTVAALYKRRQRGKLPGAVKRQGRVVVPISTLAA